MSKSCEQISFPVECHGDKFTCRKTPVIPKLIDVDMDYHDTVVVKGKKHIRHLVHVYYSINSKKTLKCDFIVDDVNRDNIPFKILEILAGYATHVCQYHKKQHFFAHSAELMSLANIKFEKKVSSKDFNSREEMASDLTKYLQDKKQAEELTNFLKKKESKDDKYLQEMSAVLNFLKAVASKPDLEEDPDVPDSPLVGVEENPGPHYCCIDRLSYCHCLGICADCDPPIKEENLFSELVPDDESNLDVDDDDSVVTGIIDGWKTVPDPPLVGIEENPGPDVVNLTPSFRLHGNYVGPGHTGAKKLGDVDWSTKPVDALDAAARSHDWHYSQQPANRGAADEILAKRAWRSIAKQDGLVGKAKAAFVAAGMKAMSLIGSRNGTLLLDPPPPESIHEENKSRAPKDFTSRKRKVLDGASGYGFQQKQAVSVPIVSQINGNNGSATNSDDVPKNMQPKKERKIEKKVEKKVEKKMKTVKKAAKSMKQARKPVDTGLTATTFQETSTIQPYYKRGSKPNSKRTLFSLGVVNATGVSSNSLYVNGGVNQSIPIDKNLFIGQLIGRDLDNYEMGQLLWARYHFVPSVGSTTAGACWIFSDPDAVDVLPPTTVVQASLLNSHKGAKKHTIWKDAFTGMCIFNKNWLYLDSAIQTYSNTTATSQVNNTGDPRLTTFGVLSFVNGENISTSTVQLGEWFLECEFDFRYPQFNDLSKFIMSTKAIANSSNAIYTVNNGTVFDPFMAAHTSYTGSLGTSVKQYEDSYNPRIVYPTGIQNAGGNMQFKLPVGIYSFYFRMSQVSTGALTSYPMSVTSNIVGATYSETVDNLSTAPSLGGAVAPEFASALSGGVDALANGYTGFSYRIRIDAITSGVVATLNFTVSLTTSGTFNCGAFHANVERLPDYSASPICMFHPQGNANAFVGLSEDVRISIWNGARIDERRRLDTIVCPRQFIDMVKESMMKRYLDHDEKYCFVFVDNQKGDGFPPPAGSFEHWAIAPESYVNRKQLEDQDKCIPRVEYKAQEPESPELVVNPLSSSVHLRPDVATRLLNLVGAARAA